MCSLVRSHPKIQLDLTRPRTQPLELTSLVSCTQVFIDTTDLMPLPHIQLDLTHLLSRDLAFTPAHTRVNRHSLVGQDSSGARMR